MDLPDPRPGARDVVVSVRAAALNPSDWKWMSAIAEAVERRSLRAVVEEVFAFEHAVEALDRVESGHVTGKVGVQVS